MPWSYGGSEKSRFIWRGWCTVNGKGHLPFIIPLFLCMFLSSQDNLFLIPLFLCIFLLSQVWFQNRRARKRRQTKRKASSSPNSESSSPSDRSSSPSDRSSSSLSSPQTTSSTPQYTSSPPIAVGVTSTSPGNRMDQSPSLPVLRCTNVCCSPPPIFSSPASYSPACSSPSTYSTPSSTLPSFPGGYPSSYYHSYQGLSTPNHHPGAFYNPYYYHQLAASSNYMYNQAGAYTQMTSAISRAPIFSVPANVQEPAAVPVARVEPTHCVNVY